MTMARHPTTTAPGRATVRAVYAEHLVALLEEAGIPRSRILSGTGLGPGPIEGGSPHITFAQQLRVYTNAATRYPGNDLGIRLGQRIRLSDHGVLGFAVQSSRDLAQAFRICMRFMAVAGPLLDFELKPAGATAVVVMHELAPLGDALPLAVDEALTVLATQLLAQTEPATRAVAVTVPYTPGDPDMLESLLGCRPEHRAGPPTLTLRARDLVRPFRLSDEETAALCEARLAELVERLGNDGDLVATVRRLLVEDPRRYRSLDAAAAALHVSGRTLRRRLADEGTAFRALRDEVLRALAIDYLEHTDLGIDDVADLLGYADVPNFYRAFRRWTGHPPGRLRDRPKTWRGPQPAGNRDVPAGHLR